MKWKIARRIVLGSLVLYPLSYLVASRGGYYEPAAYGLLQGRDGKAILAPKACFGYNWIPFESFYHSDGLDGVSVLGWVYRPLLLVDRSLWHKSDKWESRPDLTTNYFDYEAREYRPGEKDKANKP